MNQHIVCLFICQNLKSIIMLLSFQYVYDRDTFSSDDIMGEAELDINPIVEALKMRSEEGLPNGTTLCTIPPNRQNRLAERSQIVWENGQVVQNMVLRLKHVESGEVELQLRLKLPNS